MNSPNDLLVDYGKEGIAILQHGLGPVWAPRPVAEWTSEDWTRAVFMSDEDSSWRAFFLDMLSKAYPNAADECNKVLEFWEWLSASL